MPENYQQAAAEWAKRACEHGEKIEQLHELLRAILPELNRNSLGYKRIHERITTELKD